MVDVVRSIYEMLGRATQPLVEDSSAKEHVEKIFHVRILLIFIRNYLHAKKKCFAVSILRTIISV